MANLISTAIVTGGSRGIGKATAFSLAKAGYQVFITYVSKPEEAESVIKQIQSQGGKAKMFNLDVSNADDITHFFNTEVKEQVNLSVLINNAGITKDTLLLRMKNEDFDQVIDVNLRGAFICMREAAKIMTKQRYGRIINVTSVVGQSGNAGQVNYAAAKAGLIGMTKSAAKELASRNITVNAVAPGFIATDMTANLSDDIQKAYQESIPLKRLGTPEDIAEAILFLVSPSADYITGQILAVNGGMYC